MRSRIVLVGICLWLITACSKPPTETVTIAINPWPGYEFLFLAEQKGFFKQVGANIKLVQLSSLADAQRAYVNGRVDGFSSTLIEAVQAQFLGGKPIKVSLIPDYSNGGDVIIAGTEISDVKALKGKTVGCEVTSLGIFVLQRALAKAGLTLDDITIVNTEQFRGEHAVLNKEIDAFVSYPPVSIRILDHAEYHTVFSSADIPFEIIDTVSIAASVIEKNPQLVPKLHRAWQMALDFSRTNPVDAFGIMADREGLSAEDFKNALSDLVLLDNKEQKRIFAEPDKLQLIAKKICETLVYVKSIDIDCATLPDLFYRGTF